MWDALLPVGRDRRTGGYHRYAWTPAQRECEAWFTEEAARRGLDVEADGNGNTVAWWRPDPGSTEGGVVTGSHLDSVPDGGAYDGPLGVLSALAAIDLLRARGLEPSRPLGVAVFAEEEGARFGVACLGSRLMTGTLDPGRARDLRDADGVRLPDAMERAGVQPALGPSVGLLHGPSAFVELHVEQGRGLVDLGAPVGLAEGIWPHGRWRFRFEGEANHAGTTPMADRRDPMLTYAMTVLAANKRARLSDAGARATFGRLEVEPNGANAVPSAVSAWLDARAPDDTSLRALVGDVRRLADERAARDGTRLEVRAESETPAVHFDAGLRGPARPRPVSAARWPAAGAPHAGGPRRGRPRGRRHPHRHAVRPQPDRGLARTHGVRRTRGLPGRGRGARRRPRRAARARTGPAVNPEAGRTPGSAPTASYWCELAWLPPGEARRNVLVNVTGTRVTSVEPDVPNPPPHATRLPGLTLPGFANVHSHAFHRALRGRTESAPTAATTTPTTPGRTRGSFWTWRDQMYALAGRLDPESYGTLARAVYAEMALAGITCVGEFHYLHHGPDGTPYADPNVMTDVLVDAARAAGIRIVLLDTCYLAGGIGRPLTGVQRRFGDGDAYGWAERVDRRPRRTPAPTTSVPAPLSTRSAR